MKPEDFREHAHTVSDWMAEYLETIEMRRVRSDVRPGDILKQLPEICPETGEAFEAIFRDFQDIILPGMTHWQHPRFFAYFNANASPPSVLAEMLTAAMAAQCMLWETSPSAAELEDRMTVWLRHLLGLPGGWMGSIQDSASTATLCAIIAGCERATGGRFSDEGLAGGPRLAVYTSSEAHSSVEKGARIAGLGRANVRKIGVDADFAMDPQALKAAIVADREAGIVPACIVASFGATGLGSIDPLGPIAAIAREEGIHLHVDGAWAGSALIVPEVRALAEGLEHADSFVFNPHKWLFTNFDCSVLYLKDPKTLARALSLTPAYLESVPMGESPDYRDLTVSLGRRFRALKLWFVLRSYGAEGLREKIRGHIAFTGKLAQMIEADPDFELVSGPRLALLGFRFLPRGVSDPAEINRANEDLVARINDDGRTYLTKTRANGRTVIRFVIGQTQTEWRHVEEGWAVVQELAGVG